MAATSLSGQQSHAEMFDLLLILNRLLGEVIGLWEAIQGQALMEANRVLGEQCHQDGFHHYHGNVLANTRSRARPERLEVTSRSLVVDRWKRELKFSLI